jgi:predicted aspartyl protease
VVSALNLPFRGRGSVLLGDGSESEFDIHEATVAWAGERRLTAIDVAETDPLLGIGLLLGNELTIQVTAGGVVALRRLRLA